MKEGIVDKNQELRSVLSESEGQRLWDLFVDEVNKDAGIKVSSENFLGSVKKHKQLFKKALFRFNND